jgi:hypothetical protein
MGRDAIKEDNHPNHNNNTHNSHSNHNSHNNYSEQENYKPQITNKIKGKQITLNSTKIN